MEGTAAEPWSAGFAGNLWHAGGGGASGRSGKQKQHPDIPYMARMPISWGGARGVNEGIYGIHGASGKQKVSKIQTRTESLGWIMEIPSLKLFTISKAIHRDSETGALASENCCPHLGLEVSFKMLIEKKTDGVSSCSKLLPTLLFLSEIAQTIREEDSNHKM